MYISDIFLKTVANVFYFPFISKQIKNKFAGNLFFCIFQIILIDICQGFYTNRSLEWKVGNVGLQLQNVRYKQQPGTKSNGQFWFKLKGHHLSARNWRWPLVILVIFKAVVGVSPLSWVQLSIGVRQAVSYQWCSARLTSRHGHCCFSGKRCSHE